MKALTKHLSLYLLMGLLIVFPLGQLSRIPLPWPEVKVYWQDLIIAALWLVNLIAIWQGKLKAPKLTRPILLFGFVGLISLGVNAQRFTDREVLIGSLYLVRWLAYAGVYWTVLELSETRLAKVKDYLLFAGIAAVVLGLVQYVVFPNAWPLVAGQWDPHVGRIIGTFLDPGFTGLIYVFTFLVLLVGNWDKATKKRFKEGLFSYFLLLTSYFAILLTYSRASYLALVVGVGVVSGLKHSWKFFLGFLLLLMVSLPLLPRPHGEGTKLKRQSTILARLGNWQHSLMVVKDHPALGMGFNLYRYEQKERGWLGEKWQVSHAGAGADSSYLFIGATTGLVGLVAFFCLAVEAGRLGWQKQGETWGLILISSLAAAGIHAWFNNSLFYPWVVIWLWMLVGIGESKECNGQLK